MTEYIGSALSPAHALDIVINEEEHKAVVEVSADQLSLAIGKGGQNVRLAAKLTGWRIDIKGVASDEVVSSEEVKGDIIKEDTDVALDEGLVDDGTGK